MYIPFKTADILIPNKKIDLYKWMVIACDQYTSDNDYWNKVKKITKNSKSTLDLILPEIYLNEDKVDEKINNINDNMKSYLKDSFDVLNDSMIYFERTLENGKVREGLIGCIDLEYYSYEEGSNTLVRATEKTIKERIIPRIKIRENAILELPHIMILIDDINKTIIEPLKMKISEKELIYQSQIMMNGGYIKGYKLNKNDINDIYKKIELLKNNYYNKNNSHSLLFAVGDGNHSLATAKYCYEKLKKENVSKEIIDLQRYALVEIVNLHSEALEFKSINRVLFNVDEDNFIKELNDYFDITEEETKQKFRLVTSNIDKTFYIKNPKSNIVVGSIQMFLDDYVKKNNIKIDYIHGTNETIKLAKNENNIGIIFEPIKKEELFETVIKDGYLPVKTFSMGNSNDKRFYLEARRIK